MWSRTSVACWLALGAPGGDLQPKPLQGLGGVSQEEDGLRLQDGNCPGARRQVSHSCLVILLQQGFAPNHSAKSPSKGFKSVLCDVTKVTTTPPKLVTTTPARPSAYFPTTFQRSISLSQKLTPSVFAGDCKCLASYVIQLPFFLLTTNMTWTSYPRGYCQEEDEQHQGLKMSQASKKGP